MKTPRAVRLLSISTLVFWSAVAPSGAAEPVPTDVNVRALLLGGGYSETLAHVDGLIPHGQALVPGLRRMLAEIPAEDPTGSRTAAFPFNAVLLLGWIGGDSAREELVRYARAHPAYRDSAEAALAGLDLRAKLRSRSAGLAMHATDIHTRPSFRSTLVRSVPPRTPLRVVRPLVPGVTGEDDGAWMEVTAATGEWRGFIARLGPAATLPIW